MAERAIRELPTLQIWGKIFSGLLLGALGVAYLVWRRPVLQAQAILETSPLGSGRPAPPLVDLPLYFKTSVAIESVLGIGLWAMSALWRQRISTLDILGVLGAGLIVAFVVHLLLLGRVDRAR